MKIKLGFAALAALVAFVGSMAPPAIAEGRTHSNVVIDWNQTMLNSFATAKVPAAAANRLAGVIASATFDAVNGIERKYTAIHVQPAGDPEASPEAAAASATYTALVTAFPAQKQALDAALASSIASLSDDDTADSSVALGVAWGNSVGAQIMAWRAGDGFMAPPPPYTIQTAPGQWQPTPGPVPPCTTGPTFPPCFRTLATTIPFALTSPSQFRPAGPPALTSDRYAADLNELIKVGGATSATRTPEQTQTAVFWQVDTPPAQWDRVADALAMSHHLNLLKTARLLALVNISLADAIIAVFDAKNFYNSWRPVTAIDVSDPSWRPLLVTPYFQEYPSAHAGVSSAAATILASAFGDDTSFSVTSAGLPGVQRTFSSFGDAVAQVSDARVWAGFHFRFSCDDGAVLGSQVAGYVAAHLMLPAEDGD
jgi:hypothetical protein